MAPQVHHHGPVDHLTDHGEVVLDQQDGGAALALHGAEHRRHLRRLVDVETRGRLVRQQDLRLGRQGAGQLDQPAVPEAERVHRRVGQRGDPHQLQDGLDVVRLSAW